MANSQGQALSVSALAGFIQSLIQSNISSLWVRGEISNFKKHSNGNCYFSLVDSEAKINVVMMARARASRFASDLKDGIEVILNGRVSYYKKEGQVNFFCEDLEFVGLGILKQKFDELKRQLEKEGLIPSRRRPIPRFPAWVGVVTSRTGAAVQDILKVSLNRSPQVHIILFPASVQGSQAASEIARAVKVANDYYSDLLDVLIVGRGGGSTEDLWCFNEEIVARAIANSKIPVISAVGHEIDFTIADYVADLRAPTPSAAAETAFPDRQKSQQGLQHLSERLENALSRLLAYYRQRLDLRNGEYLLGKLKQIWSEKRMALDYLTQRLNQNMDGLLSRRKAELCHRKDQLSALSPSATLKRGFTATFVREDGKLRNVLHRENKPGESLSTLTAEGWIYSTSDRVELSTDPLSSEGPVFADIERDQ